MTGDGAAAAAAPSAQPDPLLPTRGGPAGPRRPADDQAPPPSSHTAVDGDGAPPKKAARHSGASGGGGSAAAPSPIPVQVINGDGFIWDADDARRLRADHRLVGAMVGSVAGFKQQNSFCGLPLRLGPAELAVAVRGGWAAPYEVPCAPASLDPFHPSPPPAATAAAAAAASPPPHPPPSWRAQVVKGTPYAVPLTLEGTPRVGVAGEVLTAAADPAAAAAAAPASSAAALADARAAAAFVDLHARGYALTPGGNFGADWLAYPADPALYHAQLAVRAGLGARDPLDATLLAAAARGAHAARKHLVLAVPVDEEEEVGEGGEGGGRSRTRAAPAGRPGVFYLTIAPEAGFGPAG